MDTPRQKQPGDTILNRYMPEASPEEREEARENLRRLARHILRVEARIMREAKAQEIRTTEEGALKSDRRLTPPV